MARLQDLLNQDLNGYISMADLDAIEQMQRGQSLPSLADLAPGTGYIQRTGGERVAVGAPNQAPQAQLDYASPLEIMGSKGYRIKGDPNRALLSDGRMVTLNAGDVAAQQALRQKQEAAQLDMDIKRADLASKQGGEWHIDSASGMMINNRSGEIRPIPQGQAKPPKLSATSEKELYEADELANVAQGAMKSLEAAKLLNADKDTYSGAGALLRAKIASNLPFESAGADKTIQLDNIIREQALTGMKAIFGGNPTEGERAILMEIQASADKTPEQRKALIDRGIALAESRMKWNQGKANMIRSGGLLQGMPQQPEAPAAPQIKDQGSTIDVGGQQMMVVGRNQDGSIRIKDPKTGRTGTVRQ